MKFAEDENIKKIQSFIKKYLGLNQRGWLLVMSAFTGLVVSVLAIILATSIEWLSEISYKNRQIPFYLLPFVPMAGALATGILVYIYKKKGVQGGGVEETIKLVRLKRVSVHKTDIVLRLVTSIFTLGTGGSAGKEGPVVHIGGATGAFIGKVFHFPDPFVRTLAGAGVAAAIAAAFQAPIAGSFFALEILLANFTLETFSMIIIAAVSSTAVSQGFSHVIHHFYIDPDIHINVINLGLFLVMGVAGGLVTVFFISFLTASEKIFKKIKIPVWTKPALGGLLLGGLALLFPGIYGEGYNIMNLLLSGNFIDIGFYTPDIFTSSVLLSIFILLVLKIIATALTISSGGSGGTIIPALFIGTTLGAFLGIFIQTFFPWVNISQTTWVLVGMSAVISAMTQAPVFSIMLFFELTKNYEVILPVLLVSTVSILVSRHYLNGSLYSLGLEREGIRLYQGMEQTIMETIQVKEIIHHAINLIDCKVSLSTILNGFLHTTFDYGFVIDQKQSFMGIITLDKVKQYINDEKMCAELIAEDLSKESKSWVLPEHSLLKALEIMDNTDQVVLPVLENISTRKPIGYITRKDVITVYNRAVIKRGAQSILIESDGKNQSKNTLQVGEEFQMETIAVPAGWCNKSLKEIDLRVKFNLTVIGIRKDNEFNYIVPDINYKFKKGDNITIVGKATDIHLMFSELNKKRGFFDLLKERFK